MKAVQMQCSGGCGYMVTWHRTHCCGACQSNPGSHGPHCDRQPAFCPGGCGFVVTWHGTHCCGGCALGRGHGPMCHRRVSPLAIAQPSDELTRSVGQVKESLLAPFAGLGRHAEPPVRILCMHGCHQTAEKFARQMMQLQRRLGDPRLTELVYVEGPHPAPGGGRAWIADDTNGGDGPPRVSRRRRWRQGRALVQAQLYPAARARPLRGSNSARTTSRRSQQQEGSVADDPGAPEALCARAGPIRRTARVLDGGVSATTQNAARQRPPRMNRRALPSPGLTEPAETLPALPQGSGSPLSRLPASRATNIQVRHSLLRLRPCGQARAGGSDQGRRAARDAVRHR